MAYSREKLEKAWSRDNLPQVSPLKENKDFGFEIPAQYFEIQDWCLKQGAALTESFLPDLSATF